ncbi:MAG TPA: hypothetical protein PLL10_11280, partial [Elusimicrobiales bacterium]|nr:hypothetical protein [Elusimicrobiales bacterium]
MVRSVRGSVGPWLLFLVLVSVPLYFAAVHVYHFFSDKPITAVDPEAQRLRQERVDELLRRKPKPPPPALANFQEQEKPKPA